MGGEELALGVAGVDDEDAAAEQGGGAELGLAGGLVGGGEDREVEGGSLVDDALGPHGAAEHLGEALADREAEAGAAVLAGGRVVDLAKRLEQAVHAVGADADAGVGDRELQLVARGGVAVALGELAGADGDGDLAAGGELDGVADEVDEDLAQAGGVGDEPRRGARVDDRGEVEALVAELAGGDEVDHGLDEAAQLEGVVLELELVGLDLGEVEDVVDEGEQRVAGAAQGLDEVALVAAEGGVEQQAGHADDGVHRRADLVAHVGQEGALGPVGGLGGLLGLGQRGLVSHALGDVGDAGAHVVVAGGGHADQADLAGDVLAGGVAVHPLEHRGGAVEGGADLLAGGDVGGAAVGLHGRAHGAGADLEQLLAREAVEGGGVAVGVDEAAGVGVDDDDGLGGVLEEGAEAFLALAQGVLGPAALDELLARGEVHAGVGDGDGDEAGELADGEEVVLGELARLGPRGGRGCGEGHGHDHHAEALVLGGDGDGGDVGVGLAGAGCSGVGLGPRRVGAPGVAEQAGVVGGEARAEALGEVTAVGEGDQVLAVEQIDGGGDVGEVLGGVPEDRGDEGGELDLLAEAALDVVHGGQVLVTPGHARLRWRGSPLPCRARARCPNAGVPSPPGARHHRPGRARAGRDFRGGPAARSRRVGGRQIEVSWLGGRP